MPLTGGAGGSASSCTRVTSRQPRVPEEEPMPSKSHDQLERFVAAAFEEIGAGPTDAAIVARHMIGANLAGHDSHGVILLPTYVERARKGDVRLDAAWTLLDDTP